MTGQLSIASTAAGPLFRNTRCTSHSFVYGICLAQRSLMARRDGAEAPAETARSPRRPALITNHRRPRDSSSATSAVPGIVAAHQLPGNRSVHVVVVIRLGLAAAGRVWLARSPENAGRRSARWPPAAATAAPGRCSARKMHPCRFHVGGDAQPAVGRPELAGQVDGHHDCPVGRAASNT